MAALGKKIRLSKCYFVRLPLLHALDWVSFPLKQQNPTLSNGFRAVSSFTHFSRAFDIMRGRTACETVTCMEENSMFRGGTALTHYGAMFRASTIVFWSSMAQKKVPVWSSLAQAKLPLGVTWSKINFYLEQVKFHFASIWSMTSEFQWNNGLLKQTFNFNKKRINQNEPYTANVPMKMRSWILKFNMTLIASHAATCSTSTEPCRSLIPTSAPVRQCLQR